MTAGQTALADRYTVTVRVFYSASQVCRKTDTHLEPNKLADQPNDLLD